VVVNPPKGGSVNDCEESGRENVLSGVLVKNDATLKTFPDTVPELSVAVEELATKSSAGASG